ncbi:hypothetical protein TNCV_4600331 [Trichonephila clavipes]|nr:hypothetical protein TNCV_4600331 [Trichonephila clavipes]
MDIFPVQSKMCSGEAWHSEQIGNLLLPPEKVNRQMLDHKEEIAEQKSSGWPSVSKEAVEKGRQSSVRSSWKSTRVSRCEFGISKKTDMENFTKKIKFQN